MDFQLRKKEKAMSGVYKAAHINLTLKNIFLIDLVNKLEDLLL